ncbi:MAG: coenzyme F420-0:L-glutamate ligase [Patescibacteria group bacterium]
MHITPIKTPLVKTGDDITKIIHRALLRVKEGSVIAITSKVVSLSEGRFIPKDADIRRSSRLPKTQIHADREREKQLEILVRKEADKVWPSEHCWLALKNGMLIPNAGIDESNAFGGFILWPKNAFESAKRLHDAFKQRYKVKRLGVLITDSWTMPLRHGVIGIALGYFGFEGQKNYVGKKDLMGRRLRMTKVSAADCLASAAVLAMGEGDERTPIAVIEDAPVTFITRGERGKLKIHPRDDIYTSVLRI